MKKISVIAALALCVVSCGLGQKPNQYKDAVKEEIIRLVGADAKVSFNTFELKETTTFADELEYRKGLIEARHKMNIRFQEKYSEERMPKNAGIKRLAILKDEEVLKGLDAIQERIEVACGDRKSIYLTEIQAEGGKRMAAADSLDKVAYYVFQFTGEAKCQGTTSTFKDYFACVTPDGRLLSLTDNEKAIHKGLGNVLGGYRLLLGAEEKEE